MVNMPTNMTPVPNTWYVNKTGKLVKVKMLAYSQHEVSRIMIEYLEGTTQLVDIADWSKLDLERHAWVPGGEKISFNN